MNRKKGRKKTTTLKGFDKYLHGVQQRANHNKDVFVGIILEGTTLQMYMRNAYNAGKRSEAAEAHPLPSFRW